MKEITRKDFISNLSDDISEIILTKLPIRDAVRTCVLSTKWRYRWSTMKQLVFDENCVHVPTGSTFNEKKLYNFVLRCLFLHDGHIDKFRLSSPCMDKNPAVDQFLLFLSRKGIKEIELEKDIPDPLIPTPSALFSCQQLISLNISGFEVKTPVTFRGFPFLKYLSLEYDLITRKDVENLISSCPLLEKFIFANCEYLAALRVHAPNLKHLTLDGNFEHIHLEHAPLLVAITIDIDTEASEGNSLVMVPATFYYLKFIELKCTADFEYAYLKAADMDFWEKECPADFIFKHLKMMASDRSWIGRNRFNEAKYITEEYKAEVDHFIIFAIEHGEEEDNGLIRCPCQDCRNRYFKLPNTVKIDLYRHGIMQWYTIWNFHEEKDISQVDVGTSSRYKDDDMYDAHDDNDFKDCEILRKKPNETTKIFYKMVNTASKPIYPNNVNFTPLEFSMKLLEWKNKHNCSNNGFDDLLHLIGLVFSDDHKLPQKYYTMRKMIKGLHMQYEKIDACENDCMLFYKEHSDKTKCDICNGDKYQKQKDPKK
ncbi:hypothetical protein AgCh_020192 [Apium graveolens]